MKKSQLNPTENSSAGMSKEKVVALLNQELANVGDLYSQTKQAHWNVRGKRFYQLHLLFDSLAEAAQEHWDDIAERAVQLGGYAKGTSRMTAASTQLPEWPANLESADDFVAALAERFAKVANSIRAGIDKAGELDDMDTADLFTEISRALDKSLWMLEASK